MPQRQRYIELDLLRSLAIVGMVMYHTAYDLSHFYEWDIDVFDGGWKVLQLLIASLFLGLVGVAAAIGNPRMNDGKTSASDVSTRRRACKRFLRIGVAALLISIVTYVIDPETYVRFGILHLIAISALILPMIDIYRRPRGASLLLLLGVFVIGIGFFIDQWYADGAWRWIGIPVGFPPENFRTVDYYPLIPWLGVVLIGYAAGSMVYTRFVHQKTFLIEANKLRSYEAITWPGRHSLLLYLIHQPIIIGILWILLGPPKF